ncbi:MAG TPA: glycosyltransferase family 1 protein [Verrucomicrobia bacterium]|nr:glycosyltransferase family 1 protein [Verrucomicrobiales bacterium]HIL55148.1 glycosyltransferase family 1 protein [Verrucomicrobiota bacterium]
MENKSIEVILGNSNRRFSGVTSTMLRVLEHHKDKIGITVMGKPHLSADVPSISFWRCAKLCRSTLPDGKFRVFHARRNNEVIQALILKRIFKAKIKIIFTSTAQREHTWITRWLIKRVDCLVATCSGAAAVLKREPDAMIPHGVDLKTYRLPDQGKKAAWGSLGYPGKYGIGIFARVRQQKGIGILVDAMIPIMKKDPSPTVLIAGETTKSHEQFVADLKEKIKSEGLEKRILFLGKVHYAEEVPKLMRGLSIVTALSTIEGFGLPVLEAMASGCAVVASKTGAWEDIIVSGEHGLLVPCDDVKVTHEALKKLTSDSSNLESMGLKGRARIVEGFTIESEANSLLNLYKSLQ